MIIKRQPIEEIDNKLNALRDQFMELRQEVSELRRMGKDTSILDVKLFEVEPLIKMARVTYEDHDIRRVAESISGIQKEVGIVKDGDPFERITKLIESAYEALRQGKKADAKAVYDNIQALYRELPKELQKTVYRACLDLHQKVG
ncbi:MAG: hypothetical protein V1735_03970 [Nanoarchaeota archaeon]